MFLFIESSVNDDIAEVISSMRPTCTCTTIRVYETPAFCRWLGAAPGGARVASTGPQGHARVLAQHAHGFMRAQHIYYAHLHTELINGI